MGRRGVPFLPQEIIANILKRLPVKSLIRFRCVCKQWKNLINTPSFIDDHLQHSRHHNNPLLIWHRNDGPPHERLQMLDYKFRALEVLPSPAVSSKARIVGSSNGLLCVKLYRKFPSLPFFILWNPATREAWEVPRPNNSVNDDFGVGFGFTSSVNDYKIVISGETGFFDDENIRIEVYSLRTKSWKEIEVGNFGGVGFYCYPPVNANGALFWFGFKPGEEEKGKDWVIVSFDLAMEVFSLISLPASLYFCSRDRLTVYENKLTILHHKRSGIDLWVMEERAGTSGERWGWRKIFTILTPSNIVSCCIWLDEIVFKAGRMPKDNQTALYFFNLNTRKSQNFATCRRGCCVSIISNHVESLVPIGNIHV